MPRKAKVVPVVEVAPKEVFKGGKIAVAPETGITSLSAYPRSANQADFVIANVSVGIGDVQIKGIRVLKSKFNTGGYIDLPGYMVEGKKMPYVKLTSSVTETIVKEVVAAFAE